MKILHLIFGLWLVAAASLRAGAAAEDVKLTSPARKESPSLSDKKKGATPAPPAMDDGSGRYLEDTVLILGVKEEKPDADGKRKVTVRVRYALIHYQFGLLSLSFNLKSATKFVSVLEQKIDAGSEEVALSAAIVPMVWPKGQPFKVTVSLSAEPRPKEWSLLAASSQVMKPIAVPAAAPAAAAKQ